MLKPSLILCSRNLQWVLVQVFPRLRAWPIRDWPTLLGKANELESDPFERIGLIAGLVLVTWLLRPPDDMEASFLLHFFSLRWYWPCPCSSLSRDRSISGVSVEACRKRTGRNIRLQKRHAPKGSEMGSPTIMKHAVHRLLIPVDAKEGSRRGVGYAINLARQAEDVEACLLYIVAPVRNWEVLRFRTEQEIHRHFQERSEVFLQEASAPLKAAGISCMGFSLVTANTTSGGIMLTIPSAMPRIMKSWRASGTTPCSSVARMIAPSVPAIENTMRKPFRELRSS